MKYYIPNVNKNTKIPLAVPMEELKDAIEESSPLDVNTESSPVVPEETPSPKVEQKEVPFHEHPRWKEVQEDRRMAQERADRLGGGRDHEEGH